MKFIKILLSCCLFSLLIFGSTKANSPYDYLQNHIISGTGSEEDPYILDRDFNQISYFDQLAKQAVQPTTTMTLSDFSGNLTGTAHTGQLNGSTWTYSSGGYSNTSVNGVMRINTISYCSYNDTVDFALYKNSSNYRSKLNSCLMQSLFGTTLINSLKALTVPSNAATAAGWVFSILMNISSISNNDASIASNAALANHGMLVINYSITYNGSWYQTYCFDTWSTYTVNKYNGSSTPINSTAYEPNSSYGTGNFNSKAAH